MPMIAESIVVTALAALIAVAFGNAKVRLLMVAVPEFLPIVKVVAALPRFIVVAPLLKRLPVDAVVEIVPPFTATLPEVVILPFEPLMEKWVAVILPVPMRSALTILELDRSIALVI